MVEGESEGVELTNRVKQYIYGWLLQFLLAVPGIHVRRRASGALYQIQLSTTLHSENKALFVLRVGTRRKQSNLMEEISEEAQPVFI